MGLNFYAALFMVWTASQAEALLDHEQHQAVRDLRNSSRPLVQSTCMSGSDLCVPTSSTRYMNTTITQTQTHTTVLERHSNKFRPRHTDFAHEFYTAFCSQNVASDADANDEMDSGYQYHTDDGDSQLFGFNNFPPNIAIKLPQFCIQLLGLRIGNCPTDDKEGDKDGGKDDGKDDDKEDDKDEDDDDKKSSKASSATSTTSTSSCTVTVTATHRTVFCSITRSVNDSTHTYTDAKTTCLTSAYTTITGCSVLNSVATVTTTRTSDPKPSDPLCGPGCGIGGCQAFQPPGSAAADAPRPQKPERRSAGPKLLNRGEPSEGEWRDPSDYPGGYHEFMEMEFDYMRRRMNFGLSHHHPKLVLDGPPMPNERESLTTVRSNWVLFQDKVETLAVEGLVGCTVVVVISDRGAWMGKFYEKTISNATLFAEALSGWKTGRQAQDDWTKYARYGIDDLRNHPERRDIGEVFGSDDDAVAFPVRILVITPRRRVVEHGDERSAGPPVQLDYEEGGMPVYPQVRRIVDDILEAIPQRYHDESLIRFYPQEQLTEEERYHRENGELSDMYWSNMLQDRILHTAKGKVMLQYQPANRCTDDASWRIWVDDYAHFRTPPSAQFQDEWSALDGQFFSEELRPQYAGELYSRQECPIRGKPASGGGSMSSVSPSLATSAGQGMPGASATLSGSGGRTQSLLPGSSYVNGTAAPLPWNSSVTTHRRCDEADSYVFLVSERNHDSSVLEQHDDDGPERQLLSVVKTVTVVTATVIVPAGPTSSEEPKPKPWQGPRVSFGSKKSVAVYVMYEEVMAGGSETIANGEMFVMFPVTVDSPIKHCEVKRLGWKPTTFFSDRSWPPSMEARNGGEAFGRKKCVYKAKQDGFGSFKCEGVAEFNCFKDADYDKTFNCMAGLDSRTYRPRMRCVFPDK
ncbi:Immunoglobulin a1 protease [Colletotrichum higginsianum IMI 349063]|uniref:Immunoglobulin a1 protease n=1 Tax=Colletotrichum higginsianum (strain IMI 349063) TaxID=759273 RepID=A0A1B7YG55_COLHI|nr:Immunoglobulin a1 protease [Colletotrichum higginsianum IMI 349063]OBR11151.1 Immunoglobulin a1 protease [Colletotrichum higginsianum IMI 349063]